MKIAIVVAGVLLMVGVLLYWLLPDIIIFRVLLGHGF
jgi:hypothetical protein